MRVLLINPETPENFWTFRRCCEFVGRNALTQPLSLITVAALLPPKWEFRLVDCMVREVTDSDWDWANMVMFTGMLPQRESLLALIRKAKRKGKLVVAGGPYPTSLPHEVLEAGCDFLVRGEGENTIPLLLAALEEGKTTAVIESPETPCMSESPTPRFDLVNFDDYITLGVQTSRGCPFDCEFCDIVNLYGRKPRYKTGDQLIDELETIYRLGWRREVLISDDNFIGSKSHAISILDKLIPWMKSHGEPFSFWTQTSVNLGQDMELIDLMTEANFSTVFVGIESPDEEILERNRKFQNIRNPLQESIANINANGLSVVASFVIGFDGEKKGAGERITSFVDQTGIPVVMLNVLHALPNTRLWERLREEGRLLKMNPLPGVFDYRPNFVPSRSQSEIMAEYLAAWDYLYEPSHYLERSYRYYLKMRPTRAAMAGKKQVESPVIKVRVKRSIRETLRELSAFLRLSWKQGIRPNYRTQYWKQLIGMWRRNPSRLVPYLSACALGENSFPLRGIIRDGIGKGE